jgi:endonuclease YncB( thermonuclease family)
MARRNSTVLNILLPVAIFLLGLSAYEYYTKGAVTWHRDPMATVRRLSLRAQSLLQEQTDAPFVVERSEPAARTLEAPKGVGLRQEFIDPGEPRFELVGRVSRVVDGDSIEVRVAGSEFPVRLFGIDSPEFNQPHGETALRALNRKLDGRTVAVSIEDIDNYGRLVGTVYHRGHNINLEMVAEGHAWWYERYARSEDELKDAERLAQEAGLGLWNDSQPVAPWEWRQAR